MTTLREAAQQALEALNGSQYRMNQYGYQAMETTIAANSEAITVLRAALAEQAQPVAWTVKDEGLYWTVVPLYTTPPAPVAPVAPVAPPGWRMVPEEPTQEMAATAGPGTFWIAEAKRTWRTMVAAAPEPPTPPAPQPLTDEEILLAVGWERAEMYMKLTPNFPVAEAKQETLKNARAVEAEVLKRVGVQR